MHFSTVIATLVALSATAFASDQRRPRLAFVYNNCSFPVTVWGVFGAEISPGYTLDGRDRSYALSLVADEKTGGRAFKVTRSPDGLFNGSPELIFSFYAPDWQVWYDLSSVFGDALPGSKLVVATTNEACPQIVWPSGTPPAGSQVKVCPRVFRMTLTLCAA